ncbi:MAG: two-component regulator propeller domain-containing protein [Polyangiaceae bacterium]
MKSEISGAACRFAHRGFVSRCVRRLLPGVLAAGLFTARSAQAIEQDRLVAHTVRRTFGVTEGLPSISVLALAQTPDGYMWMGTQSGLVRFDGHTFAVFDAHNVPALASGETIRGLAVAPDGSLWIATDGAGLLHYERGRFIGYSAAEGISAEHVNALAVDSRNVVWVGTSAGLDKIEAGKVTKGVVKELEGRAVARLFADNDGTLWIGMIGGGTMHLRGDRLEQVTTEQGIPEARMSAAARDKKGALWLASRNVVYRLEGERFVEVFRSDTANQHVDTLYVDRNDTVWVGFSRGGFRAIVGGRPRTEVLPAEFDSAWITSIVEDHEGGLWLGGFTSGVTVLHDASFRVMQSAQGPLFVFAVLEARDRSLWVGGPERLLVRFRDGQETKFTDKDGLPKGDIWALHEDGAGGIVIGHSGGANLWDGAHLRALPQMEGMSGARRVYSFTGRSEDLWIASLPGVLHWDGKAIQQYGKKEGLPSDVAASLYQTRDGTTWVGTFDGPARFVDGHFEVPEGPLHANVFAFEEDAAGTLWIATFSGLARYKNGKVIRFLPSSGLPVSLNRIIADRLGNLWLAASTGICMAPLRELEEAADTDPGRSITHLRCFDESHGLRSRETNCGGRSVIELADHRLAFGTTDGLAIVDPAKLVTNRAEPPVAIQEFEIDGSRQPAADRTTVPAGTRHIRFQYAAMTYVAPKRVHYRYKLEGYDRDWVDARDSRAAQYTNLSPGDYRFIVLAENGDGVWNERGASIGFHKQAYFYETRWFLFLVSAMILGTGAGVYALRVRRLKATARLLESTVVERTRELRQAVGELEVSHKALQEKDERINGDLLQAKAFQQAMLSTLPSSPSVAVAARYEALEVVGGDIYDICEIEPGRFRIFLADTTGHGIQASLRTMVIKAEYDRLKTITPTPSALLSQLNTHLASNPDRKVSATACCIDVRITPQGADVTYSNAAHPDVLRLGEKVDNLYMPGMYLGFFPEVEYADDSCKLDVGHALLVYSDGATELPNAAGELFGSERLGETVRAALARSDDVEAALGVVASALAEYRGDAHANDDITLILFRIAAPSV